MRRLEPPFSATVASSTQLECSRPSCSTRSKRLRMVRTVRDAPNQARFERVEHDGREHSSWVLDAAVTETGAASRLTMRLHYGGRLWVAALDRLLTDEIERSRPRLLARVTSEKS